MFVLNANLAAVALVTLVFVFTVGIFFRRISAEAYAVMRDKIGTVNADLQEYLDGLYVIQIFGQQGRVAASFRMANEEHRQARLRVYRLIAMYFAFVEAASQLCIAVVLWIGARAVATGEFTIGGIIAFVLYLTLFFSPIQQLSQAFEVQQQAAVGWRRIAELLRTSISTVRVTVPAPLERLRGNVELRDVSFRYPGTSQEALQEINLQLPAGKTVALVGESGAGKSTLVKLLARFYDPSRGSIHADGIDIRRYDPREFRRRLGIVTQEPFLFSGSIRDNIIYGKPEATEGEIEYALRTVGAASVIARLPDGLRTRVGDRGSALSAGERQLVALARTQLVDPDILLLDEATAFLDPATEAIYLGAVQELSRSRLAIVIAHRLSTAASADLVVLMRHGRVAELGSHNDLLAVGGIYAQLWEAATLHDEAGNRAAVRQEKY